MNLVLDFLSANRSRLELERYGVPEEMSCVLVTPRFRASRHVVVVVLGRGTPHPVLVVKVPRLADEAGGLRREAENLRAAQAAGCLGLETIPRLVAFEQDRGRAILVETALVGRPIDPPAVRRDPPGCVDAVLGWLTELVRGESPQADDWYERLIERPLLRFTALVPAGGDEPELVARTLELLQPLRAQKIPLVFEHGDLCHPNLLRLGDGRIGAVDWELAEPYGLPCHDLCFFLAYAAFTRRRARTADEQLAAFHEAFSAPGAWATAAVAAFARRIGLDRSALTPLFLACWARYTAGLLARITGRTNGTLLPMRGEAEATISDVLTSWLRANRYYRLWWHALERADDLAWPSPA